jgi:hypothetical protein
MIYNDEFVWLHFPKCAGTKIERLFLKYFSGHRGLHQDPFTPDKDPSVSWHDSIADRESRDSSFQLGERIIVCSFRRLSSWLESRYSFEYQRSPHLPHMPERLLEGRFLEADGTLSHAEYYVHKYLPDDILALNPVRFLRMEYFETDFKTIFGEFLDISHIPDSKFSRKVNVSKKYLPRSIKKKLYESPEQIYSHCPSWQKIEALAYGCE